MAAGRRVLVSGMGGDLGSRVAEQLEQEAWVGELVGIDVDPPRRRLHRAAFHLISPVEHDRTVETITAFDPHVVVHLAVWEPHSRASPSTARQLTDDAATSILGAAAECRALESVVVRSGIEVYGRAHGAPTRPGRVGRRRPDVRLRARCSPASSARPRRSVAVSASASAPSAWAPSSDPTCRARSGGCCGCLPSRSASSPIHRSPWSRTSSWRGRSCRRHGAGSPSR